MSLSLNTVRVSFRQVPQLNPDDSVSRCSSITSSRNNSGPFAPQSLRSSHPNDPSVLNHNDSENGIGQRNIPIEVVAPPSGQEASQPSSLLLNNNNLSGVVAQTVDVATTRPSFGQRHPALARLFSGFVAVLAFPFLLAANLVVTPFLMGTAFFSKACGSGELAKKIGASAIARVLWARLAFGMEVGRVEAGEMAEVAFPVFSALALSPAASGRVYTRMLLSLGIDESDQSPENLAVQRAINAAPKLNTVVQKFVNALPENERAKINVGQWEKWTTDITHIKWTEPLAASLKRWYESGPRKQGTSIISPEFATRMGRVLEVIQCKPDSFIPFLSSIGLSGLGTCNDRPVTVFLDLELRTQARQTLMDIKEGKKSLQDMLDIAVKRLIFDETFKQLASEMQKGENPDPIEAVLHAWRYIQKGGHLDIPALPYILFGTSLSQEQAKEVAEGVVAVVTEMKKDKSNIVEFLTRDESPVPWKEAVALLPSNAIQSEAKAKALEALQAREDALEPPDTSDYSSPEYNKYLGEVNQIRTERKSVESRDIELNGQGRWVLAEIQ